MPITHKSQNFSNNAQKAIDGILEIQNQQNITNKKATLPQDIIHPVVPYENKEILESSNGHGSEKLQSHLVVGNGGQSEDKQVAGAAVIDHHSDNSAVIKNSAPGSEPVQIIQPGGVGGHNHGTDGRWTPYENNSNMKVGADQEDDSRRQFSADRNQEYNSHAEKDFDRGFSTPSQTSRSKISSKRFIKAFQKSENRLKKQMERHGGSDSRGYMANSRGTIPRRQMENETLTASNYPYGFGMPMQPPSNVYYVNSSFDRQPNHQPQQCRLACCMTPGSVQSLTPPSNMHGGKRMSASRSRSRKEAMAVNDQNSQGLKQQPETFYINTITNNYYQVKRKEQQMARTATLKQGGNSDSKVQLRLTNEAHNNKSSAKQGAQGGPAHPGSVLTLPLSIVGEENHHPHLNRTPKSHNTGQNQELVGPTPQSRNNESSRATMQQHGHPQFMGYNPYMQHGMHGHHHPFMPPHMPFCTCMHGSSQGAGGQHQHRHPPTMMTPFGPMPSFGYMPHPQMMGHPPHGASEMPYGSGPGGHGASQAGPHMHPSQWQMYGHQMHHNHMGGAMHPGAMGAGMMPMHGGAHMQGPHADDQYSYQLHQHDEEECSDHDEASSVAASQRNQDKDHVEELQELEVDENESTQKGLMIHGKRSVSKSRSLAAEEPKPHKNYSVERKRLHPQHSRSGYHQQHMHQPSRHSNKMRSSSRHAQKENPRYGGIDENTPVGGAAGSSGFFVHTPHSQRTTSQKRAGGHHHHNQHNLHNQSTFAQRQMQASLQHQKSLALPSHVNPLSRQSQSNSHAMTVKEKDSRKRSLSSRSSISQHTNGGPVPLEKGNSSSVAVQQHNNSKNKEFQMQLKSPVDHHRVQGAGVVLTPLGNENLNGAGRNAISTNYGGMFREHHNHHNQHHEHHHQAM